jgi:hypothetical protein
MGIQLPDSMTVETLRLIEKANPTMPQYVHRMTARNYDEFMETLYVEIDSIVAALESDANVLQDYDENAFNADICRQLRCKGYNANHDKNSRGHADIAVEYGRYTWIGEGKKVDGVNNSHLRGGYNQLVHRYVTGSTGATQAGLLVYCLGKDAKRVITKWREHLGEKETISPGYAKNISANADFTFWSESAHVSSGQDLKIKHICLNLHWSPP